MPNGTTALWGFIYVVITDVPGILYLRDGTSDENAATKVDYVYERSSLAARPGIIKATNGIFDIRERDAATEIATFIFELWGWFS
ncbi:hypothetical protein ES705_25932 [subsurface metagenome]